MYAPLIDGRVEGKLDVAPAGHLGEGVEPFGHRLAEIHLSEVEGELAVLEFAEVENLVDETPEHFEVLVGEPDQVGLARGEVGGRRELRYWFGDESQGGAQVVGDIGVECQL